MISAFTVLMMLCGAHCHAIVDQSINQSEDF